ncbi:MAG: hypothetical protein L6Q57_07005 [Alphaproteobacteria bacterium]|nr:hypothetical protein [Alphaproteobacteria bacterium]
MTTDNQIQTIETAVFSLMEDLEQLAPHPDQPHYRGPLFVQIDSAYKPAADYEGMGGLLGAESVLGAAFTSAVSNTLGAWAGRIDWSNTLDTASEYLHSRCAPRTAFNLCANAQPRMVAYLRDLPRRMGIERLLAHYMALLANLKYQHRYAAPALIAA